MAYHYIFRFHYVNFVEKRGRISSFEWSQSSNPMTTSQVEGFKFKDKNETGDAEKFDSFDGLAMASTKNADNTILENPTTERFWIGQKSIDIPLEGIRGTLNMDTDHVILQIKREQGGDSTNVDINYYSKMIY